MAALLNCPISFSRIPDEMTFAHRRKQVSLMHRSFIVLRVLLVIAALVLIGGLPVSPVAAQPASPPPPVQHLILAIGQSSTLCGSSDRHNARAGAVVEVLHYVREMLMFLHGSEGRTMPQLWVSVIMYDETSIIVPQPNGSTDPFPLHERDADFDSFIAAVRDTARRSDACDTTVQSNPANVLTSAVFGLLSRIPGSQHDIVMIDDFLACVNAACIHESSDPAAISFAVARNFYDIYNLIRPVEGNLRLHLLPIGRLFWGFSEYRSGWLNNNPRPAEIVWLDDERMADVPRHVGATLRGVLIDALDLRGLIPPDITVVQGGVSVSISPINENEALFFARPNRCYEISDPELISQGQWNYPEGPEQERDAGTNGGLVIGDALNTVVYDFRPPAQPQPECVRADTVTGPFAEQTGLRYTPGSIHGQIDLPAGNNIVNAASDSGNLRGNDFALIDQRPAPYTVRLRDAIDNVLTGGGIYPYETYTVELEIAQTVAEGLETGGYMLEVFLCDSGIDCTQLPQPAPDIELHLTSAERRMIPNETGRVSYRSDQTLMGRTTTFEMRYRFSNGGGSILPPAHQAVTSAITVHAPPQGRIECEFFQPRASDGVLLQGVLLQDGDSLFIGEQLTCSLIIEASMMDGRQPNYDHIRVETRFVTDPPQTIPPQPIRFDSSGSFVASQSIDVNPLELNPAGDVSGQNTVQPADMRFHYRIFSNTFSLPDSLFSLQTDELTTTPVNPFNITFNAVSPVCDPGEGEYTLGLPPSRNSTTGTIGIAPPAYVMNVYVYNQASGGRGNRLMSSRDSYCIDMALVAGMTLPQVEVVIVLDGEEIYREYRSPNQ